MQKIKDYLYGKLPNNQFTVHDDYTVLQMLWKMIVPSINNLIGDVTKLFTDKTDLFGDHKGSWQGLNKPTLSEEGMRAIVEKLINVDIPSINESIDNIQLDIESFREIGGITLNDDLLFEVALKKLEKGISSATLLLTKDSYELTKPLIFSPSIGDNSYAPNVKFKIKGNKRVLINFNPTTICTFLTVGDYKWGIDDLSKGYIDFEMENIRIRDYTILKNTGIRLLNVRKYDMKNIEVRGFRDIGVYMLNCWNSPNFEKSIIWNSDKSIGSTGLFIDRGCNNTTFKSLVLTGHKKGLVIQGEDNSSPIGTIGTNSFENCDFEFNTFGVVMNPKLFNVYNQTFKSCHFENNVYHAIVSPTNTLWNSGFDKCFFLTGDINIGVKDDYNEYPSANGKAKGGFFTDNTIVNGKVRIDDLNNFVLEDFKNYGNKYYGDTPNGASTLVSNNMLDYQTEGLMKRYTLMPNAPTRFDNHGTTGDIRWDNEKLFIKTQNGWRYVPTSKQTTYTNDVKLKLNGSVNVPSQSIPQWGIVDVQLTINGVNTDSGYVLKMTPRKWLETGIDYSCWISGTNTVTLRLKGTGNIVNMASQDWYYIIEKIDS